MQRRKQRNNNYGQGKPKMREVTLDISRSNVIDSLMPLLMATTTIHDNEKVTLFLIEGCNNEDYHIVMHLEKEN